MIEKQLSIKVAKCFQIFKKALFFFYLHSIFVLPIYWVDPAEQLINCMIRNTSRKSSLVFFFNMFSFNYQQQSIQGRVYSRIYGIIRDKQR